MYILSGMNRPGTFPEKESMTKAERENWRQEMFTLI